MGYIRALKKGGALFLLSDQGSRQIRGTFVKSFGRGALTPVGPAYLARLTGAAVLPVFIRRREEELRRHVLAVHPPIFADAGADEETDLYRVMQTFTDRLDAEIRLAPDQCSWITDRWRHDPRKLLQDHEIDHLTRRRAGCSLPGSSPEEEAR